MTAKLILSHLDKTNCKVKHYDYAFTSAQLQMPDLQAFIDHLKRDNDIPEQARLTYEPSPSDTVLYHWSWVEITLGD